MRRPATAWCRAALRAFSDTHDARALAKLFEAIPSSTSTESLPDRRGRTAWLRELSGDGTAAASTLLARQLEFVELQRRTFETLPRDVHADLFLGLYAPARASFVLESALVRRLAAAGLPLVLDLYPPGSEHVADAAPLDAPDRTWANAVLLRDGRRVRESRLDPEAPLEKHVAAIAEWMHRERVDATGARLVASFTTSSGHGVSVIAPEVFRWWPELPPALELELARPVGRIPSRAEIPQ